MKTLVIIHIVGTIFVWLWFIGSCSREGLWTNTLTFFDSIMATFIAIPLWLVGVVVAAGMIKPAPEDFYMMLGITMGLGWGFYIISFAIIHSITDGLSKTKVSFHPLADKIGSIWFAWQLSFALGLFSWPILEVVRGLGTPG